MQQIKLCIIWLAAIILMCGYQAQATTDRATACANNMRQLVIAILFYNVDNPEGLPAYTIDENGERLHSWRTLILPYMEQRALYDKIRLGEPWDSEYNQQFHDVIISFYQCLSAPERGNAPTTNYFLLTGEGTVFEDRHFSASAGKDTILLIESARTVHWMSPEDVTAENFVAGLAPPVTPNHRNFAFPDGSVEIIRPTSSAFNLFVTVIVPAIAVVILAIAIFISLPRHSKQ